MRTRFVPAGEGLRPLEQRIVPGPLLGGLWDIPQSYISLVSNTGVNYPVTGSQSLINSLQQMQQSGQKIGTLFIKGHGGSDPGLIYLTNSDPNQTLSVVQGASWLAART